MEGQPNAPSPPRTTGLTPQMRLQINNMANELQGLISLIYMPTQTQDQANAGEYNFLQLRSTVNELHKTLAELPSILLLIFYDNSTIYRRIMPGNKTQVNQRIYGAIRK